MQYETKVATKRARLEDCLLRTDWGIAKGLGIFGLPWADAAVNASGCTCSLNVMYRCL